MEELEEVQVRLGPVLDDGRRALPEDVLALLRAIPEKAQATLFMAFSGYSSQATPCNAVNEVRRQGFVVQVGLSNRHVASPPCNVREAPSASVGMGDVLEEPVDALLAFVLPTAIAGA